MEGGFRVDDTPVHRALREALANCIINTDFYGKYGVLILKREIKLYLGIPTISGLERKILLRTGHR